MPLILPTWLRWTLRVNESCFVTKLRGIIEQVNRVLKIRLCYLANVVPSKSMAHLHINFGAGVAFYNTVFKRIKYNKDDALEIAAEMKIGELQTIVVTVTSVYLQQYTGCERYTRFTA